MPRCHNSKDSECGCRTDSYPKSETYTINFTNIEALLQVLPICGLGNKQTDGHQAILPFTNPNKWTETKKKIQEFHRDRSQLVS